MNKITKIKKMRIKLLNRMKTTTVLIPNSAGKITAYTVVWKNKTYTGLSPNHTIHKVMCQAKTKKRNYVSRNDGPIMPQNGAI